MNDSLRTYGPLVPECTARGISRSVAFELVRDGLLDTFLIGRRRYVYIDSLNTLPERLAKRKRGGSGDERSFWDKPE